MGDPLPKKMQTPKKSKYFGAYFGRKVKLNSLFYCVFRLQGVLGEKKFSYGKATYTTLQSSFTRGQKVNSRCWCNKTPPTTEQNLNFFYLHYIQEINKVVYKKTLSCNTPELDVILCNQHVLVISAHAVFIQYMSDRGFLVNNFADFLDVPLKKSRFHSVIVGVFVAATSPI